MNADHTDRERSGDRKDKTYHGGTEKRSPESRDIAVIAEIGKTKTLPLINADHTGLKLPELPRLPKSPKLNSKTLSPQIAQMSADGKSPFDSFAELSRQGRLWHGENQRASETRQGDCQNCQNRRNLKIGKTHRRRGRLRSTTTIPPINKKRGRLFLRPL
jgi:hypothetical protein